MRITLIGLALSFLAQDPAPAKIDLRVLYAGRPGSTREKEFLELFGAHFVKTAAIDVKKVTTTAAADWDVVVMDWSDIYPRDDKGKIIQNSTKLNTPQAQLPEGFSRATVMMGSVAGSVHRRQGLKLDWL